MDVRFSLRVNRLLGIGSLAIFSGVVLGRVELAMVAVPVLMALFLGLAMDRSPRYHIASEVSAHRLFEGNLLRVTIALEAHTRLPLIEVLHPDRSSLELVSGSHRRALSLGGGEKAQWTCEYRCIRRGRFVIGDLHTRIHNRSGLVLRETLHRAEKSITVYPHIVPLQRAVLPPHTQVHAGNYVSTALGEGIEFGNIRPFAPGDRTKRINWPASIRRGDLYVNEYQLERNADVILMLDSLASVGSPALNTLDLSVRAAASLAWAYIRCKDRVGLIEYGGMFRWLRPGVGRAHFQALLDRLLEAEVVFSYVAKDLALVPKRILPPRAMVLAISPLLDERFVDALRDLLARGFPVVLLAVSAAEVTRAVLKKTEAIDMACRLWAVERNARIKELRQQGMTVLEWHPRESISVVLAAAAQTRRNRKVA